MIAEQAEISSPAGRTRLSVANVNGTGTVTAGVDGAPEDEETEDTLPRRCFLRGGGEPVLRPDGCCFLTEEEEAVEGPLRAERWSVAKWNSTGCVSGCKHKQHLMS